MYACVSVCVCVCVSVRGCKKMASPLSDEISERGEPVQTTHAPERGTEIGGWGGGWGCRGERVTFTPFL